MKIIVKRLKDKIINLILKKCLDLKIRDLWYVI